MPWRMSPSRTVSLDSVVSAGTSPSSTDEEEKQGSASAVEQEEEATRLRFLAGELSPLLDRLGRVLTGRYS